MLSDDKMDKERYKSVSSLALVSVPALPFCCFYCIRFFGVILFLQFMPSSFVIVIH